MGRPPAGASIASFAAGLSPLLVDRREADHHAQREDGDARNVHEHEGQRSSTVSRELHGIHSKTPGGVRGVYGGCFCCRVTLDLLLCTRFREGECPGEGIRGLFQRRTAMFVTPYLYKICIQCGVIWHRIDPIQMQEILYFTQ